MYEKTHKPSAAKQFENNRIADTDTHELCFKTNPDGYLKNSGWTAEKTIF